MSPQILFFALAGGILPALLWLWFWLQEDSLHPEPRGMLIETFIAGMIMVPLVLPVEQFIQQKYAFSVFLVVVLWSAVEELFKFIAAYVAGLRTQENDEPIDPVIYLITAALGFSAMENAFFLVTSLSNSGAMQSLITGNLRFIGATLLHVLSSGIIGLLLGLSFRKNFIVRKIYLFVGLVLSVVTHATFNIFISTHAQGNILLSLFGHNYKISNLFIIFASVWIALLVLIVGIQKVKHLKTWGWE